MFADVLKFKGVITTEIKCILAVFSNIKGGVEGERKLQNVQYIIYTWTLKLSKAFPVSLILCSNAIMVGTVSGSYVVKP